MNRFSHALATLASSCLVVVACTVVNVNPMPAPVATNGDAAPPAESSTSSASSTSGGGAFTSSGVIPNAMADEWHKGGSRLKLTFIQGADGTKEFRNWWDTEREESCTFSVYADNSLRCVPSVPLPGNLAAPVGNLWASANCTGNQVAILIPGTPPPKYVTTGALIFSLAPAQYTGEVSTGYPSSCTPGAVAGDRFVLTPLGGPAFVAGTLKVDGI